MSPTVSERTEPIVPDVRVVPTLRPSCGVRTAQRAVPTITLNKILALGGIRNLFRVGRCAPCRGIFCPLSDKSLVGDAANGRVEASKNGRTVYPANLFCTADTMVP